MGDRSFCRPAYQSRRTATSRTDAAAPAEEPWQKLTDTSFMRRQALLESCPAWKLPRRALRWARSRFPKWLPSTRSCSTRRFWDRRTPDMSNSTHDIVLAYRRLLLALWASLLGAGCGSS